MSVLCDEYLKSFPFPYFINFQGTEFFGRGSLFPCREKLLSQEQLSFYRSCHTGWRTCPEGYAVYVTEIGTDRNRITIFGLKVKDVSKVTGKEVGLSIKLQKHDVENFIKKTNDGLLSTERRFNDVIASGIHEFRHINNNIYNISLEIDEWIEGLPTDIGLNKKFLNKSKSVSALSQMLKSRSDVFDVITNSNVSLIKENVHVYRVFDRARKVFISANEQRKCYFEMSGGSESKGLAVRMFDVVPYILLHNAEKYSPKNGNVTINIRDDKDFIHVDVISIGPKMDNLEIENVFRLGFRGKAASQMDSKGSGIGLFVAKQIISHCQDSSIEFHQGGLITNVNKIEMKETIISLRLKKHL